MKDLPTAEHPLIAIVVRTDYADDAAWADLCSEIGTLFEDQRDWVLFVSDPDFEGLDIATLTSLGQRQLGCSCLFVVDRVALTDVEHPMLVVDVADEPERAFRVIPQEMEGIASNLFVSNMDLYEFAECVDADGVFRGFH